MTVSNNIRQHKKYKILLIGDDCLDEYQYGTVDRLSPEAPVPVFKLSHKITKPGMAANVKANLEALGCEVTYLHGKTSVKTRLIDYRSKQQIVRIDNDVESNPIRFETFIPPIYNAVVISDYDKGTVDYETIEEIKKDFLGPVFIDTKKTDLSKLEGCIVKINKTESSRAKTLCSQLIVTLGSEGASYQNKLFPTGKVEVTDVCGAGDTFLAALTYEYLNVEDMSAAIEFANKAATVTVQHSGVYAPTLKEIL